MASGVELKPGIYWVGAKDWNLRIFHGYKTQRGTSYNAYLIVDEKITLIDSVKPSAAGEMLGRISSIVDPAKIDYIVCNHVELDHSGAIPEVLKLAKNAKIFASPKGKKGLKEHFLNHDFDVQTVASGETLKIGRRTLTFHHTPMVHWPDSMVTYMPEENLLFSNDSFGQHYAAESLFNDEAPRDIYFYEAAKYFANIVYPYCKQAMKAVATLSSLKLDMIAPSHGIIWKEEPEKIVDLYKQWGTGETERKALIVYDSMWGSTEKLATALKWGFEEKNIPVTIRSLAHDHYSDIMTDILFSKYIAVGSPVLNGEVLPSMGAFLTYLKGLRPHNKTGFVFGSYGWAPAAISRIGDIIAGLKWTLPCDPFLNKFVPSEEVCRSIRDKVELLVQDEIKVESEPASKAELEVETLSSSQLPITILQ